MPGHDFQGDERQEPIHVDQFVELLRPLAEVRFTASGGDGFEFRLFGGRSTAR